MNDNAATIDQTKRLGEPAPRGRDNTTASSGATPSLSHRSDSPAVDTGHAFIERVSRCAATVLGQTEVGRQTQRLCGDQIEARRVLLGDRGEGRSVVAVVGPTGQGKSWLVRQFIAERSVSDQIRSGNNLDQATEKLVWIGPHSPLDLDRRYEQYVACGGDHLASVGFDYLLLDVPGATDDRGAVASVAARALSLSSVLLLVARRDQLRAEAVGMLAAASEGSVVVPVINMVRPSEDSSDDDSLRGDVESFVARIRQIAPESRVTAAVIVEDFEIAKQDESRVGQSAIADIASRVRQEIEGGLDFERRRRARLEAMDARFRKSLQRTLAGHLPNLTSAVRRINDEASNLPAKVAEGLVGGGASLAAAIRGRLRLALLADTPGFWFPYRSQLGLLNLTHGAWDRLFLSLSGSLPSLISAVYSSGQNVIGNRDVAQTIRDGLKQRSDAAVTARLGPLTRQFRREIRRLRGEPTLPSGSDHTSEDAAASLSGIDALQERSQDIFEEAIDRHAASGRAAWLAGLVGTVTFWGLMAGPILTIYRSYLAASYGALQRLLIESGPTTAAVELDSFPRPDLSLWITSVLLSILPVALLAMMMLAYVQRRRSVASAGNDIRDRHHESIAAMQNDGTLRLTWNDPLLADAEFLLSVGQEDSA